MISKNDCLSILVSMEDAGLNIDNYMKQLIVAKDNIPLEVLKFIANNRGIDVINFYELVRKNYNNKKSPLYINIVREIDNIDEVILTLNCLLTQALLYSRKVDNKELFLREMRAEEITRVLNNYFNTNDGTGCLNLLKLIKSDLLVLEYIVGRRELN